MLDHYVLVEMYL